MNKLEKWLCNFAKSLSWKLQGEVSKEICDDYCFTTGYMLNELKKEYKDLSNVNCLSITCRIGNLVSFLPLFGSITHCTMMPMLDRQDITETLQKQCNELNGDFFELKTNENLQNVNAVLSHVTIHCMSDTRYHNKNNDNNRPYEFAKKLNDICPNVKHVIVSVPVNINGLDRNNNNILSNDKFIDSFEKEGFLLTNVVYDKYNEDCIYDGGGDSLKNFQGNILIPTCV